jgi:hypothetical protein
LFCLWHHCHPGQTWSHERVVYRDSHANAPLPATTTTCVMLSQPADSDSPQTTGLPSYLQRHNLPLVTRANRQTSPVPGRAWRDRALSACPSASSPAMES